MTATNLLTRVVPQNPSSLDTSLFLNILPETGSENMDTLLQLDYRNLSGKNSLVERFHVDVGHLSENSPGLSVTFSQFRFFYILNFDMSADVFFET